MEFGKVHCGGCGKVIAFFPADNKPKDCKLELYCEGCSERIEDDNDLKDELNNG